MKENDKDNSQNSPKNKNYLNLMKQNDESKEISRKRSSKKNIANDFSRYDIEEEQAFKNNEEKTSRSIGPADSMQIYKSKIKALTMKVKKDNSSSDIISIDGNEKISDSHHFSTNKNKVKVPPVPGINTSSIIINKGEKNTGKNKAKKKKKKVTFKKKFVSYIDVESYKKYNMDNCIFNDNNKADAKCACVIY
jgi:hypothetical protein